MRPRALARFRDLPLRRRLALLIVLTSGSMILAAAAIAAYDLSSFKQFLVGDLAALGDLLSPDAASALRAPSPDAERQVLAVLKARPHVEAAAVYSAGGAPLAVYRRSGAPRDAVPAAPPPDGLSMTDGRQALTLPLMRGSGRGGTLYLRADWRHLRERLRRHAAVLGVVLLGSFLQAMILRQLLKSLVCDPLKELAAMASRIAAGDLSARAPVRARDEIGLLAESFNEMAAELGSFRDTLEAKVEARTGELTRSNRELEQFAYVASHDLQEPLRKIMIFTQLLAERERGRLDGESRRYVDFIVNGASRMQAMVRDLLAYARVGHEAAAHAPVDCAELIRRVIEEFGPAIEEAGALVTCGPLPSVPAARPELAQLFRNLLGNALKFHGDRPPRVHVSARRDEAYWEFSVQDNGIGLDPAYADRVFLLFQRLHTRADYPGTGLGLAICKKIVESHGGRIWFESTPGEGATFRFTLPAEYRAAVYSMQG